MNPSKTLEVLHQNKIISQLRLNVDSIEIFPGNKINRVRDYIYINHLKKPITPSNKNKTLISFEFIWKDN